jgi:acyl-coenzyme A thioesterase PaaI-like protein
MADDTTTEEALDPKAVLGRELADEVRGVILALSTLDVGEEDLQESLALVRSLRARLQGPRRQRWYEVDDLLALDEDARGAFHDLGPFRGHLNPLAAPLVVEPTTRDDGTPIIRATAVMGEAYEGPPHGLHGGFVAALFDEVLGATQGLTEGPGVTGRLTVHFRHVTPLEEVLHFEGWIDRVEGRRLVAKATCHAADGTLCAEADGLFFKVDFAEIQQKMQQRRDA